MADARIRTSRLTMLCLFLGIFIPGPTQAQNVDLGGRAFLDYFYTVSSPSEADEGFHGFTYRRLYLTTDFRLSDDFKGRARLEANDGTTGSKGPVPYVKDLYLTWAYSGDHSATIGVASPPAFGISEDVWGYRSLEKTIMDFQDIVDSRDFGIRFNGPITPGGNVRYAAMLANNSASKPETDPYKRGYAQIEVYPTERLTFVVGADHAGYDDALDSSTRVSGFGGYVSDAFRFGVEGYWSNLVFANENELAGVGLSVFSAVALAPDWELVARIDRAKEETPDADRYETFFLGGVAYAPNEFVRLIPNVWLLKENGSPRDEMLARFTVNVRF